MNPIKITRSLYLDTNSFIFAYFFIHKPEKPLDLDYYKTGKHILRCLGICKEHNIRVFSTDLAFLEMYYNFYEWAKLKDLLANGAPSGLVFARNRRGDSEVFLRPLSPEVQQRVTAETADWLNQWAYHDLVEFKSQDEMPDLLEIARVIYTQHMLSVLDCLHVAAAIQLECDEFLSSDGGIRKQIAAMRENESLKKTLRERFNLDDKYNLPNPVTPKGFVPPTS